MTPAEFTIAKTLEREGWDYEGPNDAGVMMFTRFFGGRTWVAEVRVDR